MSATQFTVGKIADQAGCKVETVHYYEKTGLMPEPPRTAGGHRVYDLTHVQRLNFIRRSRDLGFSIEQIRELLTFLDEPSHYCGEVRAMAMLQARAAQEKINDLERLKSALNNMAAQCKGGQHPIDKCAIINSLYSPKAP